MKSKIWTTTCVLLSVCLFTSLGSCSGGFGNPVTDDVSRLLLLKQNIPTDYQIPVHYIPKEMSGVCWVLLNIYPLEKSLKELAQMFGAISSNKDNIIIFITMLQSLRFKLDHEELEATMQVFRCHYREVKWPPGLYFDYVREIINSAAHGAAGYRCEPPSCPTPLTQSTPGREAQGHQHTRSRRSLLSLLLIPATASVFLIVWVVKFRRGSSAESNLEKGQRRLSPDVERTITASIPLHPLTSPSNISPMGAA